MSLQAIKDTFYSVLRDRVAALNPGRTAVVRGTTRPAVFVAENELPSAASSLDGFTLSWTALAVDPSGLAKLGCEVRYATAGSTGAAGMDRGRDLAALDAELLAALTNAPQAAALVSFVEVAGGGASTEAPAGTSIFWTAPAFGPAAQHNGRLQRSATVEVFGYE